MAGELEGIRVIVVEDDPIIALDVRATLERAGATVVGTAHIPPGAGEERDCGLRTMGVELTSLSSKDLGIGREKI